MIFYCNCCGDRFEFTHMLPMGREFRTCSLSCLDEIRLREIKTHYKQKTNSTLTDYVKKFSGKATPERIIKIWIDSINDTSIADSSIASTELAKLWDTGVLEIDTKTGNLIDTTVIALPRR